MYAGTNHTELKIVYKLISHKLISSGIILFPRSHLFHVI